MHKASGVPIRLVGRAFKPSFSVIGHNHPWYSQFSSTKPTAHKMWPCNSCIMCGSRRFLLRTSSTSWINRLSVKRLIGHLPKVHWNAPAFHKVPQQCKKKKKKFLENHLGKWKVRQVLRCLFHALSNSETWVTLCPLSHWGPVIFKHTEKSWSL